MKLKKLVISLIAILSLSGCSFKEFKHSVGESWVGQNILHPVYDPIRDWISGESGEKPQEKPSESSESTDSSKPSESSEPSSSEPSEPSTPSEPSEPSEPTEPSEPEGISFSFAAKVTEYEEAGFSGVEIPDYICADSSATFSAIEGYDGYYLIKPSTTEEMETFVGSFSSAWDDELDTYGDHYLYLGSPEPGESCPFIYVADYTAESLAGIVICFDVYTEPVPAVAFPVEEVNAYLTENSTYYGFTLSQAEADAISALSSSFIFQSGTDSYGYPIAYVIMDDGLASAAIAVIESTIVAAGFEYDADYEAYMNSYYCAIYTVEQEGSTYLVFN